MKKLILILLFIIFCLNSCSTKKDINTPIKEDIKIYNFNETWAILKSDKYINLPQYKISFFKLFSFSNNHLKNASKRTLENQKNILDPFEKLAHPNGICFKGIWNINRQNIYSGYFKYNTKAPIIARVSSAMSNTKSLDNRSFGFAGKIFLKNNKLSQKNSANFFLIDNLGGTYAKHFTDVELSNQPKSSFTFEVLKNIFYGLQVMTTFKNADTNANIRQLYEISYLINDNNSDKIITPKWMKIKAIKGQTKDISDFRDELTLDQNEQLIFNIFVANKSTNNIKNWQKIGNITLEESVISKSCDSRLHFHHPKTRYDLKYDISIK